MHSLQLYTLMSRKKLNAVWFVFGTRVSECSLQLEKSKDKSSTECQVYLLLGNITGILLSFFIDVIFIGSNCILMAI